MLIRILKISIFIYSIILISCNADILIVDIVNEVDPAIGFSHVELTLITDTVSVSDIYIDKRGAIFGDNIIVKQNGFFKNAKIGGHITDDKKFYVSVVYKDTVDNSILKIEGEIHLANSITGKLLYCPYNANCTFIQVGSFNLSYSGNGGIGSFGSTLVTGEVNYRTSGQ